MHIDTFKGRLVDGRYELIEAIGEGAMGTVYRAHQRVVDRAVAVKLLHRDYATHDDFRARFEREAKALGKLDHPGCVRVYDFGWFDDADAPYLVSEFVDGSPLFELYGDLSHPERMRLARDIAQAMQHAHDHGIVHRDLKPENVLVSSSGQVKVVDFGLARMPKEEEIRLTQAGDAHGTPAYMSPEQCRGDDVVTPASDVYALGCMLFEMFEDRLPYFGSNASAVLIKHVTDPMPPQRNQATPPRVRELIVCMMHKDVVACPPMAHVASELDLALTAVDQEPAAEPTTEADLPPEPSTPVVLEPASARANGELLTTNFEPPATRSPWLPWVAAGTGLLALGFAVGLIVLATRYEEPPPADPPVTPTIEPVEVVRHEVPPSPTPAVIEAEPTPEPEAEPPETEEKVVAEVAAQPPAPAPVEVKKPSPSTTRETDRSTAVTPDPLEDEPPKAPEKRDSVKLRY